MKSSEFRTGNLVYINNTEAILSATDILFIAQNERFSLPCNFITPILISENRLFSLGFKVAFDQTPYKVYSSGDFTIKSGANHSFSLYAGQSTVGKPFHYIHQLQNLYFSITGDELLL